ncbi:class I SAM-dependent methyltransferase [Salinispora pacifica]|uniref:class I SAM-dependent methyltransferase n=1 Tax=Salinispora pacifica TaxID=351187 RepID=UPI0004839E74|nr:class I SAM-dependent methyltransferase [Salinispora pacifica]
MGCGPGRVTILLPRLGLDAFGIDLSPQMVALARQTYPELGFEVGSMLALQVPDASLGGLMAYYSIIHVPWERRPEGLRRVPPRARANCNATAAACSIVSWVGEVPLRDVRDLHQLPPTEQLEELRQRQHKPGLTAVNETAVPEAAVDSRERRTSAQGRVGHQAPRRHSRQDREVAIGRDDT